MKINKVIDRIEVIERHYETKRCVIDNINKTLRECLGGVKFESIDDLTITMKNDNNGNRVIDIEIKKYKEIK